MARRSKSEQGDTLRAIRDAGFRMFGRHGFDGVSVDMVAKAAGITKAALYWHYKGKEALYTDCLAQLHTLFQTHVFARMLKGSEPGEQLLAMFAGAVSLLRDRQIREGVAGYWLEASTAELPEARRMQKRFDDAAGRLIADIIERGIRQNTFEFDIPSGEMAQAIIATLEAIILPLRRLSPAQSIRLVATLGHSFFRAYAPHTDLPARVLALGRRGRPPGIAA